VWTGARHDVAIAMLHTTFVLSLAAFAQDATSASRSTTTAAAAPVFEAPVVIDAGGAPINGNDKILYPSPVLLDVDADGARELVIGDLWGNLFVHERVANEDGSIVWSAAENLKHADGSNVQLPNW
jgi:hypothetical protein